MEFEALLLGLEPLTAMAVGVGAVLAAPVVGAVGKAIGQENLGDPLAETAKKNTKQALVWGMELFEQAQAAYAEAEESFRDLVAEAKAEREEKRTEAEHTATQEVQTKVEPREVQIVSE